MLVVIDYSRRAVGLEFVAKFSAIVHRILRRQEVINGWIWHRLTTIWVSIRAIALRVEIGVVVIRVAGEIQVALSGVDPHAVSECTI